MVCNKKIDCHRLHFLQVQKKNNLPIEIWIECQWINWLNLKCAKSSSGEVQLHLSSCTAFHKNLLCSKNRLHCVGDFWKKNLFELF